MKAKRVRALAKVNSKATNEMLVTLAASIHAGSGENSIRDLSGVSAARRAISTLENLLDIIEDDGDDN